VGRSLLRIPCFVSTTDIGSIAQMPAEETSAVELVSVSSFQSEVDIVDLYPDDILDLIPFRWSFKHHKN
jgi:hypothetical protein